MLSRTTIEASTKIPKSIAPIEMRFAEWPVKTIIANANNTAKGYLAAMVVSYLLALVLIARAYAG